MRAMKMFCDALIRLLILALSADKLLGWNYYELEQPFCRQKGQITYYQISSRQDVQILFRLPQQGRQRHRKTVNVTYADCPLMISPHCARKRISTWAMPKAQNQKLHFPVMVSLYELQTLLSVLPQNLHHCKQRPRLFIRRYHLQHG